MIMQNATCRLVSVFAFLGLWRAWAVTEHTQNGPSGWESSWLEQEGANLKGQDRDDPTHDPCLLATPFVTEPCLPEWRPLSGDDNFKLLLKQRPKKQNGSDFLSLLCTASLNRFWVIICIPDWSVQVTATAVVSRYFCSWKLSKIWLLTLFLHQCFLKKKRKMKKTSCREEYT